MNAESAVLILQEIFCKLQYSNTSVSRMGLNMSKSSLETDVRTICEELEQNVKVKYPLFAFFSVVFIFEVSSIFYLYF